MPWNNQGGGGGWQGPGGGGGGPWGRPGGSGGAGGGGGGQPPDLDDLIRKMQDRGRSMLPGGFGGLKGILIIVAVLIAAWFVIGGFYRVLPDEQGVELVFGKWEATTQPGLNYNWPAPIGEVFTPKVTRIEQFGVGYDMASGRARPDESLMLTGDENIIDVQFAVKWRIKDAGKYLFNVRDPETVTKDVAESAMREVIGQTALATALAEGRANVETETLALMQEMLDTYGAGVEVRQVELQKVDPPQQVIDAFRDVQAARADQERFINQAQAYQNEVVPRARGEAQKLLQEAQGYKQQIVNDAQGEAARFVSVYNEYKNAQTVTERRIYLETMETILENMNKTIIDTGAMGSQGVVPYLPLDELKSRQSSGTGTSGGN